jgi:DNA-binding response OmpR family regulator
MPICLVVEDDADTREGYAEFLRLAGFEVLTASAGAEMRAAIDSLVPDVVVMDLWLPQVDGFALIGELKGNPRTASVPILVVSASVRASDKERARQAGADGFVGKPCTPGHIVEELTALLAARGHGVSSLLGG